MPAVPPTPEREAIVAILDAVHDARWCWRDVRRRRLAVWAGGDILAIYSTDDGRWLADWPLPAGRAGQRDAAAVYAERTNAGH